MAHGHFIAEIVIMLLPVGKEEAQVELAASSEGVVVVTLDAVAVAACRFAAVVFGVEYDGGLLAVSHLYSQVAGALGCAGAEYAHGLHAIEVTQVVKGCFQRAGPDDFPLFQPCQNAFCHFCLELAVIFQLHFAVPPRLYLHREFPVHGNLFRDVGCGGRIAVRPSVCSDGIYSLIQLLFAHFLANVALEKFVHGCI